MTNTLASTEAGPAGATGPGDTGREPRRRPSARLGELPLYLAALGLTCLFTTLALQLWDASRAVPFTYDGDALAVGAHFKTVLETGWYENQPMLGAPFGQMYHDFPQADNLHLAAVAVMNVFVDNWAVAFNAYYLLGFPLAALTAVWFFRLVGVSRAFTLVLAVLFALLPYHFEKNQGHLFLASYYPVPLGAGVVLMALRGTSLWSLGAGARSRVLARLTCPAVLTVLAMVLVGAASTYYSIFTAILLAVAGLVALWRDGSWRRFVGAAAAGALLLATMLVNMAPDLLYARGREANTLAFTRDAGEADVYGLKLAQLLLPSFHHRWQPLGELRLTYNREFPLPSESPVLGAVAAAGLVILLIVVVSALARRRPASARTSLRLRHLALLTLVSLGVAGIGGFSTLIALFVTDNVRSWNRMSIFIALFCLAAVGVALDVLVRWVQCLRPDSRKLGVVLPTVLGLFLMGLGILDQTSGDYIPNYKGVRESYYSDAAYVREIEDQLPAGAAVYQVPHQVFPESPAVNGVPDPDPLRLYLSSTDTRWSAGGLKGRPQADWPLRLADKPISTVVPLLAVSGFSGISADRLALGDAAARLEDDLTWQLGAGPTAASSDGRFVFWPLAGAEAEMASRYDESAREALRASTLLPPVPYAGPGFERPMVLDGKVVWRSRKPTAQLLLDNPRDSPLAVHLSFALASVAGAENVEVRLPGRDPISLDLTEGLAPVAVDLVLRPGHSVVRLRVTSAARVVAGPPRPAAFDVIDIDLTDPAFESFQP